MRRARGCVIVELCRVRRPAWFHDCAIRLGEEDGRESAETREVGETEEGRGPAVSDIPDQPGGLLYVP